MGNFKCQYVANIVTIAANNGGITNNVTRLGNMIYTERSVWSEDLN